MSKRLIMVLICHHHKLLDPIVSVLCDTYSSPVLYCKLVFDVNRKVVQTFGNFGKRHATVEHFSLGMNMVIMCSSTYHKCLSCSDKGIL
jgi:hypothetical protein